MRPSLLLLLPFLIFGCTNEIESDEEIKDWKVYDSGDFSIQYPPDWELDTNGKLGTSFIFFSPLDSDIDRFKENVNLLIQGLPANIRNLDEYIAESVAQIDSFITDSEIIRSERLEDTRGPYHILLYSGRKENYHFVFEQHIRIMQNTAYCLTFASEKMNYDKYKETGSAIMTSFRKK